MDAKVAALALAAVLAAGSGAAPRPRCASPGDKLDVRATAAAVSEVLDRIARETGMKVSYDGRAAAGAHQHEPDRE